MSADPAGTEYADGRRNGDEAMASLARAVGVPLAQVLETRASGGIVGLGQMMVEHRGPYKCTGCGSSKMYRTEQCGCFLPGAGAVRDTPMPGSSLLSGDEAMRMLERRFAVPS